MHRRRIDGLIIRRGSGGGSVALKKSGTKISPETAEGPLALKKFGTKKTPETLEMLDDTINLWH